MVFAAEGLRAVAAVPSSSKTIPKDLTYTGSDQNPESRIGDVVCGGRMRN